METKGLGAGSYPTPNESKEKCYIFDFNASLQGYGTVYAESQEKAIEKVLNNEYDEIIDTYDITIEEITKIEEE